jgi:hypothetical protein
MLSFRSEHIYLFLEYHSSANAEINWFNAFQFYRYKKWLPDDPTRHDTKITYQVEIRYANNTNITHTFHGPRGKLYNIFQNFSSKVLIKISILTSGAHEEDGPVKWIRPYFDCGRSNRWLFAAVVPIVDLYPRYTGFRHIEIPR